MEVSARRQRPRFYSINVMRARHPAWFREDLERLFGLVQQYVRTVYCTGSHLSAGVRGLSSRSEKAAVAHPTRATEYRKMAGPRR